jgi:hypothetical protein
MLSIAQSFDFPLFCEILIYMKLSESFTTVTRLSKAIALILFVSLPFIGFYFGYQYKEKTIIPEVKEIVKEKKITTVTTTPNRNLMEICGDLPVLNISSDGKFTRVTGPSWSPDCRHIAWATWQSTFSNPSINVGLFVYDYATKKTQKIYTPKQGEDEEAVEFQNWENSNFIVFTKDGQRHLYIIDITSREVTE